MRGRVGGSLAVVIAVALAGCGDGGGGEAGGGQPAPSGQPERIVVAAGAKVQTLDPARATRRSEQIIASAIQTPLLTYAHRTGEEAATLEPALARDLPRLTDGRLEYRFALRPGLVYADGRLVNASDVERAIAHASKVSTDPVVRDVLDGIVGAPSTDGQTLRGVRTDDRNGAVVVRLRKPDGRMPLVLANPATAPLPELPSGKAGALPASTGPLRVARLTDDSVELVANPLRARIDTVPAARTAQISVKSGDGVSISDLSSGAVGVSLGPPTATIPENRPRTTLVTATSGATWALLLPDVGPFLSRTTREALAEAVDRRPLADAPSYRPACGLFPAWVVGAVTREDCPPVPVSGRGVTLLGESVRLAIPAQAALRVPGAGTTPTGTAPATTPAALSTPLTVATAAIESLGGIVTTRAGTTPEQALADGTADAALVQIDPSLPHPGQYLQPVAPLDALVQRGLAPLTARPLTGSGGSWSALERRAVARAIAVPLASGVDSATVAPSVDPRSVVLHPVLGLDLAALRLQ